MKVIVTFDDENFPELFHLLKKLYYVKSFPSVFGRDPLIFSKYCIYVIKITNHEISANCYQTFHGQFHLVNSPF